MKAFCLLILSAFTGFVAEANCDAQLQVWNNLTLDQKAEVLTFESDLPSGLKMIEYANFYTEFDESKVTDEAHKAFIAKMIATFDREVSKEEIEQSDYQKDGVPMISGLYLLLAENGQILGGKISYRQNGLDQEGEEGDINWQASVRMDESAEPFKNLDGVTYDDLYFEWSGH
jgi:hypothetical protein